MVEIVEDVGKMVVDNFEASAGKSIGMGIEKSIGIVSVEAITRMDIVGVQLKDGKFRVGRQYKSAFRLGLTDGLVSVQAGTANVGFESFDYSYREDERNDRDVSIGMGIGMAFVIGFHAEVSFSVSGFVGDLLDYINE